MISIGTYLARHNSEHEDKVAPCAGFATMSGADPLIGGGVVGFFAPAESYASKEEGRSPYRESVRAPA
jgi:hypothetical protein